MREIGAEAAAAFAEMVGEEFRMTPAMKRLVEGSVRRPDWHLYISFAGDTPVGTGALFVRDGVGYLDFATTRKCFRGLGGQKALIRRRIKDAIDMGCDLLTAQVGSRFDLCGDAEQSRKSLFRHGFQEAYCVEGWTPRSRAATDKT